jgi:hypothetical protein
MNLIINYSLSEPPSEISCFRDVTLHSKIMNFESVLLSCKKGTRSLYWNWLKSHGAHDYISYILKEGEMESGITMHPVFGDVVVDRINSWNLSLILAKLKSISKNF